MTKADVFRRILKVIPGNLESGNTLETPQKWLEYSLKTDFEMSGENNILPFAFTIHMLANATSIRGRDFVCLMGCIL